MEITLVFLFFSPPATQYFSFKCPTSYISTMASGHVLAKMLGLDHVISLQNLTAHLRPNVVEDQDHLSLLLHQEPMAKHFLLAED